MVRALVALLLFAAPLAAQQRQPVDYALAGAAAWLMVADWSQTLKIATTPAPYLTSNRLYTETNPLLGPHPSVGRVNTLLAIETLGTVAALALPKVPRRLFYLTIIALQTVTVAKNLHYGLAIGF